MNGYRSACGVRMLCMHMAQSCHWTHVDTVTTRSVAAWMIDSDRTPVITGAAPLSCPINSDVDKVDLRTLVRSTASLLAHHTNVRDSTSQDSRLALQDARFHCPRRSPSVVSLDWSALPPVTPCVVPASGENPSQQLRFQSLRLAAHNLGPEVTTARFVGSHKLNCCCRCFPTTTSSARCVSRTL
jgi:hypothetical protein